MNTDLRDQLRAYFDAIAADDTASREFERPARHHNKRNLALVAVALVIALVGAIAVVGARHHGTTNVKTVAPPTAAPTSSPVQGPPTSNEPSAAPWDLKWTQIADLGWTGYSDSAKAVVVDGELLVVGTEGDDASTGWGHVWGIRVGLDGSNPRRIADSPLNGRTGSSLVWTGTELFVLGGANGTKINLYGAAYNPTHDSWRVIPAPSEQTDNPLDDVVWTGNALIAWQMSSELEVNGSSWHSIAPAPLTQRLIAAEVGVDNKLFVWGGCGGTRCDDFVTPPGLRDGAIYDPASGKWTPLPPGPFVSGYGATAASRDDTVYLVADGSEESGSSPFASFSLATRSWTALPPSPVASSKYAQAMILDSGSFVYGGISDPRLFPNSGIARFDPKPSSWSVGKLPFGGDLCSLTQSGNQLIAVMCGASAGTTVYVATMS